MTHLHGKLPASDASSREHINTAVMHDDEQNMILVKRKTRKRENLPLIFNPLQDIIENY